MGNSSVSRILTITVFLFAGLLIGIMLVSAFEGKGLQYITISAFLMLAVLFILFLRTYLAKNQKVSGAPGDEKKGSEVGFVVDTFHDLVAKLKEKEKELGQLKLRAEEKAVSMEAYSENILQSVPSGVISVDNSTMIKSMNQAAGHILGMSANDVIGRNFADVFDKSLTSLLQENKTVSRAEYPYVTHDQRHIWLGITTSQLKNSSGDKIGLLSVFTDLTDIKALQYQLELKQRLSQLGEMSAGIAHELRNSMSVISGYAKLLGKKSEPSDKTEVDSIQAEIKNMDMIISELLAFAKPSNLNKTRVNVNELMEEALETIAGSKSSIKVSLKADNPVHIQADTVLLRQALSNLTMNAVEAMPDGGSLDIELSNKKNRAEINIRDTGCGIPEQIRQKIFLPFFTTKEAGTGFGLALVQKIVVSHGGSIEVFSNEGEGATFLITLPFT